MFEVSEEPDFPALLSISPLKMGTLCFTNHQHHNLVLPQREVFFLIKLELLRHFTQDN